MHCMSWIIWTITFHDREKKQGDQYSKSFGSYIISNFKSYHKGLSKTGVAGRSNCIACSLYSCKQLVKGLCISYQHRLMVFLFAGDPDRADRIANCVVPIIESSVKKPGKKFKKRIKNQDHV